jgi:hypothetical protein
LTNQFAFDIIPLPDSKDIETKNKGTEEATDQRSKRVVAFSFFGVVQRGIRAVDGGGALAPAVPILRDDTMSQAEQVGATSLGIDS